MDNGWKNNIQKYKSTKLKTHNGKALMILQSKEKAGFANITASNETLGDSNEIRIRID